MTSMNVTWLSDIKLFYWSVFRCELLVAQRLRLMHMQMRTRDQWWIVLCERRLETASE